jgi:hypothetical protein
MNKNHHDKILAVTGSFAVIALACSLFTNPIPTQTPFVPPTVTPTQPVTASHTISPVPAATETSFPQPSPEVTVTDENSQVTAEVQDYYEKGYLPYQNGQLHLLDDFSKTNLSGDIYDFTRTGQQAQDFALWADIELDSTGSPVYPNFTGCGFAYRVQSNSDGYIAMLTNNAVRMGACRNGLRQCELFGTTHGTGEVNVPNHTKMQFSFSVNKDRAYVLVDGILVGQYSLFTTKLMGNGDLYYGAVSNINAGYWTACQISNVRLWESEP